MPPNEKDFFQSLEMCTATSFPFDLPVLFVGEDVAEDAPFKGEEEEEEASWVWGMNIVGVGRPFRPWLR